MPNELTLLKTTTYVALLNLAVSALCGSALFIDGFNLGVTQLLP